MHTIPKTDRMGAHRKRVFFLHAFCLMKCMQMSILYYASWFYNTKCIHFIHTYVYINVFILRCPCAATNKKTNYISCKFWSWLLISQPIFGDFFRLSANRGNFISLLLSSSNRLMFNSVLNTIICAKQWLYFKICGSSV